MKTQQKLKFLGILLLLINLCACCKQEKIPQEISNLYSEQAKQRNQAAQALSRCGDLAERAVPRLAELMYDPNVGVQSSAAYALRKIDTKAARAYLEKAETARRNKNK